MSTSSRRVLVTGGAGFIGSHVADAYLARGDDVWVVDDLSTGKREHVPEGARFHEMSVADPDLRRLFREVGFDLVNHHAAQIDVRKSVEDPLHDARVNLLGLLNVAEAAVETGTSRLVFVSSGGVVYGEADRIPTPETASKRPESPYGVSKLSAEYYLRYYRRTRGLDSLVLRYANVYGPRQDPYGEAGVVAIFSERLSRGQELAVFGDGEQTRDYVFVKDVVSANMKASELPVPDGDGIDDYAYNVGTGVGTSVNRLADHLEEVAGTRPGREYRAERPGELRHNTLDASRLQGHGWAPHTDLRDGLRITYRYIVGAAEVGA